MDWLREFYLFFQNSSRRSLPVSSETVLYRCFKEYFSLKISKNFTRKLQQFYYELARYRKRAIRSKRDLWTVHKFQTKSLWELEMLQKLLLLKVLFTKVIKAHSYFLWQCFLIIFMRQTLADDFWGLHKNKNCTFPLSLQLH